MDNTEDERELRVPSLVFHSSFYEASKDFSNEDFAIFWRAINEYAFYSTEIQLPKQLKPFFALIKPVLDSCAKTYINNSKNGKKGGAPKGNKNAVRKGVKTSKNNLENNQSVDTGKQPVNQANKDKDKDKDKDIDKDKDTAQTNDAIQIAYQALETPLVPNPEAQKDFASKIHKIFKDAGLSVDENEVTFQLSSDFKDGLSIAMKKDPNPEHIIKACENYASVYNKPGYTVTFLYSFYTFVKNPHFIDYLPQNFKKERYLDKKDLQGRQAVWNSDHPAEFPKPANCNW